MTVPPHPCARSAPSSTPGPCTAVAVCGGICSGPARSNAIGRARVDEVLETVGLAEVAARRAGALSLGMGQRLGIAAALLGDPGVLILDEPVNGLDTEGIRWRRWSPRTRSRHCWWRHVC